MFLHLHLILKNHKRSVFKINKNCKQYFSSIFPGHSQECHKLASLSWSIHSALVVASPLQGQIFCSWERFCSISHWACVLLFRDRTDWKGAPHLYAKTHHDFIIHLKLVLQTFPVVSEGLLSFWLINCGWNSWNISSCPQKVKMNISGKAISSLAMFRKKKRNGLLHSSGLA